MNLEQIIERTVREFDWCKNDVHVFHDLEDEPEAAWPAALSREILAAMTVTQLRMEPEIELRSEDLKLDIHTEDEVLTKKFQVRITHLPSGLMAVGEEKNNLLRAKQSAVERLRERMAEK